MIAEDLVGPVVFSGLGVYIGLASIIGFIKDRRALRWPKVVGEVVRSEVVGGWKSSGDSNTYMYTVDVEYTYQVSGIGYRGDRFRPSESSSTSKASEEKTAAKFPLGAEIEVLYDPSKPESSLLRQGIVSPLGFAFRLIFGLVFLLAGIFWYLLILDGREKEPSGEGNLIQRETGPEFEVPL